MTALDLTRDAQLCFPASVGPRPHALACRRGLSGPPSRLCGPTAPAAHAPGLRSAYRSRVFSVLAPRAARSWDFTPSQASPGSRGPLRAPSGGPRAVAGGRSHPG